MRKAVSEISASRYPFIAVEIHHTDIHRFRPGFVLIFRVDLALRMVGIFEIDDMAANMV